MCALTMQHLCPTAQKHCQASDYPDSSPPPSNAIGHWKPLTLTCARRQLFEIPRTVLKTRDDFESQACVRKSETNTKIPENPRHFFLQGCAVRRGQWYPQNKESRGAKLESDHKEKH